MNREEAVRMMGDMMMIARKMWAEEKSVPLVFILGNEGQPALVPPEWLTDSKEENVERVRQIAEKLGVPYAFAVSEAWVTTKNDFSTDGEKKEVLMVSGSGRDLNTILLSEIFPDGSSSEPYTIESSGGLFSNLSGNEMLN